MLTTLTYLFCVRKTLFDNKTSWIDAVVFISTNVSQLNLKIYDRILLSKNILVKLIKNSQMVLFMIGFYCQMVFWKWFLHFVMLIIIRKVSY